MAEQEGMGWGSIVGAAAPIAGAIYGMFQNKRKQDERQVEQQKKLTQIQADANREQAKYTSDLQYDMWNKTNAEAQVEHYKAAGLNPGLMYEGMGSGGTTGSATAAGVAGGSAADSASTQQAETSKEMGAIGMGMQAAQLSLLAAQKENIEADTENKKSQAALGGEDLNKRKFDTLTQGEEWTRKIAESQEAREGLPDRLKRLHAEATGAEIENDAKKVGIDVDKTKIKQMLEQVAQGWAGLEQGEQRLKIEKFKQEIEANYPGVWNVAGKYVNDFVDGINRLMGLEDYKKHEIKK